MKMHVNMSKKIIKKKGKLQEKIRKQLSFSCKIYIRSSTFDAKTNADRFTKLFSNLSIHYVNNFTEQLKTFCIDTVKNTILKGLTVKKYYTML